MNGTEKLQERIDTILNNPATGVQLYLVLKNAKSKEYIIRKADLESNETETEVADLFEHALQRDIVENIHLEERNLSDYDNVDNAIYKYNYDEYPEEMEIIRDFDISEAVKLDMFDYKKDDISKLFGFFVYIGTMKEGVMLFKKHYSVLLMKRDTFLLVFKSNKRIEKVKSEDMLKLNDTYQIIKISDDIYVKDVGIMEKNLGFTNLIKKEAESAIAQIGELGLVEEVEVLTDSLNDIAFARKLAKAMKSSPVFQKNVSRERIIEFTKRTSKLKDKFKYSDDGNSLRLSTNKSKMDFIKLLNDDFLKSELTEEYYDARSKDQI